MSKILGGLKKGFTYLTGIGQKKPGFLESRFRRGANLGLFSIKGRETRMGAPTGVMQRPLRNAQQYDRNTLGQALHVTENTFRSGLSGAALTAVGGGAISSMSKPTGGMASTGSPTLSSSMGTTDENGVALRGAPSKEEQKAAQKAADDRIKERTAFRQKVSAGSSMLPSSLFEARRKESQWTYTAGEAIGSDKYKALRNEITKAYATKNPQALAAASERMHQAMISGVGHDSELIKNIGKEPYMLPGSVKDRQKRRYAMFLVPNKTGGWTTEFLETDWNPQSSNQEEGPENNGQP